MDNNENADVVDIVLEQHVAAKKGLTEVSNASGEQRGELFAALAPVLAAHEAAEEAVIYPALRELGPEGTKVADERTREEQAADQALTKLKGMDAASGEFDTTFESFKADVLAHAAKEEAEVLPLLKSSCSDDERRAMGESFLATQTPAASKA